MRTVFSVAAVLLLGLAGALGYVQLQSNAGAARASASWVDLAPLNEPRQEVAVAELGGKIYTVAGFRRDTSSSNAVEVYDPSADRWDFAAPLPQALNHAGAAAVGGILYVFGGHPDGGPEAVDTVYAYDPQANSWSSRASMPTARGSLAVAVVEGKIYLAGGSPSARERDFAVYDPASDTWTKLPQMPTPRNHLAAAGVAGKVYVAGGRSSAISDVLEEYDPATGAWTRRANMPTARGGIGGAPANGRFYVFGGEGNRRHPLGIFEEVEAYDPSSDSWQRMEPMMVPRHGIGAAPLDGRIYIPGGAVVEGFGVTPINQALVL